MHDDKVRNSALILASVAAVCLLGVGIGFDWAAAVVIVVIGTLLWLGYQLAIQKLSADRLRVDRERAALDAEWQALDRSRRVRDVYWSARHAMRDEAQRYWPNTDPDQRGQR